MNTRKSIKISVVLVLVCFFMEPAVCATKSDLIGINQSLNEADCIANTKQIRENMTRISENKKVSQSDLQRLHTALRKNQEFYQNSEKYQNIRELLFGHGEKRFNDYDLFYKFTDVLLMYAQKKLDTNSFATAVWLPTLLRDVLSDNAELGEYWIEIAMDFALAAPFTMVKYLDVCSQNEFDLFFLRLTFLYEFPSKRKELESELIKISAKEKKYAEIIEKIIRHINKDCIEYHHGDEEYNYCNK